MLIVLVIVWALVALLIINITADDAAWRDGAIIAALWPVALPLAALTILLKRAKLR